MTRLMRKSTMTAALLMAIGGSVYAYYRFDQAPVLPAVTTVPVSRGSVVETVGATGTLQAVTTVQVGSQVSGAIQSLNADYNSIVRKGQVIARLDPSLFETQIEQSRASLIRAEADLERLAVGLDDARTKFDRARELFDRHLLARSERDAAEVAVRSAEAQLRSAEAQVTQARASLNQSEVNLRHTVITAPIDGIVISRSVDVGQTVAATMQAPTLFVLAADLTQMQVVADLDESDVGRIRPRQRVSFRVDAYPAELFGGTVSQVRLNPQIVQNVVTYATVIDVPNPELKLKPGMTANVTIEVARRDDVLTVPNAALRFRPTAETFAALAQEPPPAGRPAGSRPSEPAAAGPPRDHAGPAQPQSGTIDALFGPLPVVETSGAVWTLRDGQLTSLQVRLGLTDGQVTELVASDLGVGAELVTRVASPTIEVRSTPTGQSAFPFTALPGRGGTGPAAGGAR
jgi:HlyD family secretion protein